MTQPLISIIMPTFNQAEFLQVALDSIYTQSVQDWQLIVVNDGSSDDTLSILKDQPKRVTVINQENQGPAEAINTGIDRAQGIYWTWVSSDNIMHKRWLEVLLSVHEPHLYGASYGGWTRFNRLTGLQATRIPKPYDPDALVSSPNCYFGPAFLIHSEVWVHAGPHRGRTAHDYDHWARVEEACWELGRDIEASPHNLCAYRDHPARFIKQHKTQDDSKHWQAETIKRREEMGL